MHSLDEDMWICNGPISFGLGVVVTFDYRNVDVSAVQTACKPEYGLTFARADFDKTDCNQYERVYGFPLCVGISCTSDELKGWLADHQHNQISAVSVYGIDPTSIKLTDETGGSFVGYTPPPTPAPIINWAPVTTTTPAPTPIPIVIDPLCYEQLEEAALNAAGDPTKVETTSTLVDGIRHFSTDYSTWNGRDKFLARCEVPLSFDYTATCDDGTVHKHTYTLCGGYACSSNHVQTWFSARMNHQSLGATTCTYTFSDTGDQGFCQSDSVAVQWNFQNGYHSSGNKKDSLPHLFEFTINETMYQRVDFGGLNMTTYYQREHVKVPVAAFIFLTIVRVAMVSPRRRTISPIVSPIPARTNKLYDCTS